MYFIKQNSLLLSGYVNWLARLSSPSAKGKVVLFSKFYKVLYETTYLYGREGKCPGKLLTPLESSTVEE